MDFNDYPFDSHQCKFLIGSTGYSESFMKFKSDWSLNPQQRPLQYKVYTLVLGWFRISFLGNLVKANFTIFYSASNDIFEGNRTKLQETLANFLKKDKLQ